MKATRTGDSEVDDMICRGCQKFGPTAFAQSGILYIKFGSLSNIYMHFVRHRSEGTGFMATAEPADELPLQQAGEVWAPGGWSVRWHTNPGWELYVQAKGESWW